MKAMFGRHSSLSRARGLVPVGLACWGPGTHIRMKAFSHGIVVGKKISDVLKSAPETIWRLSILRPPKPAALFISHLNMPELEFHDYCLYPPITFCFWHPANWR